MGAIAAAQKAASPAPKPIPTGVKACERDIRRFCSEVKPGEGRVGSCLYGHLSELSKPCRRYAGHGGKGHELECLRDIDAALAPEK